MANFCRKRNDKLSTPLTSGFTVRQLVIGWTNADKWNRALVGTAVGPCSVNYSTSVSRSRVAFGDQFGSSSKFWLVVGAVSPFFLSDTHWAVVVGRVLPDVCWVFPEDRRFLPSCSEHPATTRKGTQFLVSWPELSLRESNTWGQNCRLNPRLGRASFEELGPDFESKTRCQIATRCASGDVDILWCVKEHRW